MIDFDTECPVEVVIVYTKKYEFMQNSTVIGKLYVSVSVSTVPLYANNRTITSILSS